MKRSCASYARRGQSEWPCVSVRILFRVDVQERIEGNGGRAAARRGGEGVVDLVRDEMGGLLVKKRYHGHLARIPSISKRLDDQMEEYPRFERFVNKRLGYNAVPELYAYDPKRKEALFEFIPNLKDYSEAVTGRPFHRFFNRGSKEIRPQDIDFAKALKAYENKFGRHVDDLLDGRPGMKGSLKVRPNNVLIGDDGRPHAIDVRLFDGKQSAFARFMKDRLPNYAVEFGPRVIALGAVGAAAPTVIKQIRESEV